MAVLQKVTAFRSFLSQCLSQVADQVVQEFEHEVSKLHNDISMYRHELNRCAEILGHQLGRERQLHVLLEKQAEHQTSLASSTQFLALQKPTSQQLHDLVEQMSSQFEGVLGTALQGASQASVFSAHALESAKQLQEPMISAEHEFARICQLLQVPVANESSLHSAALNSSGSMIAPQIGRRASSYSSPSPSSRPAPQLVSPSFLQQAGSSTADVVAEAKREVLFDGMERYRNGARDPLQASRSPSPRFEERTYSYVPSASRNLQPGVGSFSSPVAVLS